MSTYLQVQNRIADELNRTDLSSQIQSAVKRAINRYERRRWWFNETSSDLAATIGQAYIALPSDYLMEGRLWLTLSGRDIPMVPKDLDYIVSYRPSSNSRPQAWCIYQNRIELDAKPDTAYAMPFRYIKQLTTLSADGDTSAWTTECEDLIVWSAMRDISATVIHATANDIAILAAQERDVLRSLLALNSQRIMTGNTKPVYL